MRKLGIFLTAVVLFAVLILMMGSVGFFNNLFVNQTSKISLSIPTNPFTSETSSVLTQEVQATENLIVKSALGNITVTGSDTSEFEITLEKESRSSNSTAAQELLDAISLSVEQDEKTTTLVLAIPKRAPQEHAQGNLTLVVPKTTLLNLSTDLGNIEVTSMEGNLQAYSNLGALKLANFTGAAALETALGNIEVSTSSFPRELVCITKLGDLSIQGDLGETTILESDLGDLKLILPTEQSYVIKGRLSLGRFKAKVPFKGQQTEGVVEGILGTGEQKGSLHVNLSLGSFEVQHD